MERKDLIKLCEKSIVKQEHWGDRDSSAAHKKVGKLWALLKAGCKFRVITEENKTKEDREMISDNYTLWVEVIYRGFTYFEHHDEEYDKEDDYTDKRTYYLPHPSRIKKDKDWY